jgi:hypothetical protein
VNGAQDGTGLRQGSGGGPPRDAEIRDLDGSIHGKQNILRFDVTMDQATGMGRCQSRADFDAYADRFGDRQRSRCLDRLLEGLPIDEFHDNVVRRAVLPNVKDTHDVGMR